MRARVPILFVGLALAFSLTPVLPASADHTDPRTAQSPTTGAPGGAPLTSGEGTWTFIKNFQANPGTDLKFFQKHNDIYSSSGTLGGGNQGHVGQRIIRLTKDGVVAPEWVADHGSAKCNPASGVTGLQHDAAVTHYLGPKILIDTTDSSGRCHDPGGGGLEFIDIRKIQQQRFKPREIHLTRHAGLSHTVTVDATRPWVVYNSSSDFAGRPWIDVLDIRTCLANNQIKLDQLRERCRPKVYRIKFQPEWSMQRDQTTGELEPAAGSAACHDITARPGRLYCAAIGATLIFDVRNLTDTSGNIRGTPLPCTVMDGTNTAAKVTNCSATDTATQQAQGWVFLGTWHHAGRDCGGNTTNCNSNLIAPSDQDVAISHEADPMEADKYVGVTDERGGGVVPPGASCNPGVDNPYGNGGLHILDIRNPANIQYALMPSGDRAVFRGEIIVPAQTFCDIHVFEPIQREQRFITAYYAQGAKIVDYRIDTNGRWSFIEVASITLPNANTWAVQNFMTVNNPDGTVTYYFLASDIQRGIDIYSWTGPKGTKIGHRIPAAPATSGMTGNLVLVAMAAMLPVAAIVRRRRSRAAAA